MGRVLKGLAVVFVITVLMFIVLDFFRKVDPLPGPTSACRLWRWSRRRDGGAWATFFSRRGFTADVSLHAKGILDKAHEIVPLLRR